MWVTQCRAACAAIIAVILAACGGGPRFESPNAAMERSIALDLLLAYDSNQDYALSAAEFENALRADFSSLDQNSDGALDPSEVSAENDRRWRLNGSASTPLIDWNTDGFVDFAEFTSTPQSTFTQIDENRDGNLSAEELSVSGTGAPAAANGPGAIRAPLNARANVPVGG
jgi:hypothetical protein